MTSSINDGPSCPDCQALVNETAKFCESCGHRLSGASSAPVATPEPTDTLEMDATVHAVEFDSSEGQKLAREMLSKHLDLISETSAKAKSVERTLSRWTDQLARLSSQTPSAERTGQLEDLVESLEASADDWEDLQRSHNDRLEALDEDFLDRFAEIDLDAELPPKQQEKFDTQMSELLTRLNSLEVRIAEQGELAMGELARAGGRFSAGAKQPSIATPVLLFLAGLAGSAAWLIARDGSWLSALLPLSPVLVLGVSALTAAQKRR